MKANTQGEAKKKEKKRQNRNKFTNVPKRRKEATQAQPCAATHRKMRWQVVRVKEIE